MLSEASETYLQNNFDYDSHISVFLHTSAMYFEINSSRATSLGLSDMAWPSQTAINSQEVPRA